MIKNVFNWTIGSFFRTIGRIIAYIGIGLLFALILSKSDIDITNLFLPKLSAATLTPRSTYPNNTNHIIGQDFSYFGSNYTYSYSTTIPNLYGEYYWQIGNTGTAISGQAYALSLGFQTNLSAQKYYDITINFRSTDLRSNVNTSSIYLLAGNNITTMSTSNLSLIGVTNNATTSVNSNKLVIRAYSVQANAYFAVQIYDMQNNITGVNNFGISSVSIQEVDITNSDAIINNQTNNTQNIINNNNDNTQDIINNQNELLGNKCSNIFNPNFNHSNHSVSSNITSNNDLVITTYDQYAMVEYNDFQVKPNTTYNLSFRYTNSVERYAIVGVYTPSSTIITEQYFNSLTGIYNLTFNTGSNSSVIIRFFGSASDYSSSNTITYSNIMVSDTTSTYCKYGSFNSKLDDTNNAINGLNDTINDDTISDDKVNNAINGMEIPQTSLGPFAAFLTIPLQWVQTILGSGQSCETLHLPLPFVNRNLDLPCMTDFWTSTGAIGTLIQACWICVVAVRIFNGLFLLTVDILNPDPNSAAELTKIKSWEL